MNSVQKELVKYIERSLNHHYQGWDVEVSENMFGAKWAVVFIEKTDKLIKDVFWFPYKSLLEDEEALFIVSDVLQKCRDMGITVVETA